MDDARNFGGTGGDSPTSFHSIEQPMEPKEPVLGIVMRVKQSDGSSILPNQLNEANVARFCWDHTGVMPDNIEIATGQDIILDYSGEVNLVTIAMKLQRVKEWQRVPVEVSTNIAGQSVLREICESRLKAQVSTSTPLESHMDVRGVDIPTPQVSNPQVEDDQNEIDQATSQLLTTLGSQIDKKVSEAVKKLERDSERRHSFDSSFGGMGTGTHNHLSGKAPKLQRNFNGQEDLVRNPTAFEQWVYEVRSLQPDHTETAMRAAVIRSLSGPAFNVIRYLGPEVRVNQMISKLEIIYGNVMAADTANKQFYEATQEKTEMVQDFAARLEGYLNTMRVKCPERIPVDEQRLLKDRLFRGMGKALRDSIRYLKDDPACTYADMTRAAREAEMEGPEPKGVSVKAKSAVDIEPEATEEESPQMKALRKQVEEFMTKQVQTNKGSRRGRKNAKSAQVTNGKGPTANAPRPSVDGRPQLQCYNCLGWGHIKRNCPSPPLNLMRGENKKTPPTTEKTNTQNPTNPGSQTGPQSSSQ